MEFPFSARVVAGETNHVIYVDGDLDISTVPRLTALVRSAIAAGVAVVRIDLEGVDFMDSTGITALIQASLTLRASGRTLFVSRPRPLVARVIDLCGARDTLRVVDTDNTPNALD